MSTNAESQYILGTHDEELARLGFQHRVWGAQAFAIWERAEFAPGCTILDVGCGPGFAALDLARLVGPRGRVIAVDESARFIEHLKGQLAAQLVRNVEPHLGDVQRLDVPAASVDAAYARWVLCFVKDPAAVAVGVARALRPGGVFAVQDYFNYRTLTLAPRSAAFDRVIEATDKSWRMHGGDPDIVARLPRIFRSCGLQVREIRPILRVARPGSSLWEWPTTFFHNFVPTLVKLGLLTPAQEDDFRRDWAARSADPDTFFVTPPVYDVIAVKR